MDIGVSIQMWLPAALAIIVISVAITAIIYMLSRILNNDEMKRWAQNEIYQAFASIILLTSAVVLLGMVNGFMFSILGVLPSGLNFGCDSSSCHFLALSYDPSKMIIGSPSDLASGVTNTTQYCGGSGTNPCQIAIAMSRLDMMYDMLRYYAANKIATAGTLQLFQGTEIGWNSFTAKPFAFLDFVTSTYQTGLNMLTTILLLLKANSIFLLVISTAIFPMFLVAGIALRAISFMRKVGGLLLAIALGLYFVYPMLIILSTVIVSPNSNSFVLNYDDLSRFVTSPQTSSSSTSSSLTPQSAITTLSSNIANTFSNGYYVNVDGTKVDWLSYNTLNVIRPGGFIDSVAFITVWIGVPFLITLYSTFIFIREFSTLIGGDTDIAGLSRLM